GCGVTSPPFPVVGSHGEVEWWVVNQQTRPGGPRGPAATNYVVVSTTGGRVPPNKVAGPFSTKSEAQDWQSSANAAGNSPGSAAGAAIDAAGLNPLSGLSDLAHRLTEAQTWVRVAEVLAGLILLYVGLKSEFPTTVNTVTAPIKKAGKGAAIAG